MEKICNICGYPIKKHYEKHISICTGKKPNLSKFRGKYKDASDYNQSRTGKPLPKEVKDKISKSIKGKKLSQETKDKISQAVKGKTGGIRKGGGRGKSGWYKGYWCDSSWELAYVIYNLEHGIKFERNKQGFEYEFEDEIHKYYPDFLMEDGSYIEVKGYMDKKNKAKHQHFDGVLNVLEKNEMKPYLEYAINKYGKNFIKLYEME